MLVVMWRRCVWQYAGYVVSDLLLVLHCQSSVLEPFRIASCLAVRSPSPRGAQAYGPDLFDWARCHWPSVNNDVPRLIVERGGETPCTNRTSYNVCMASFCSSMCFVLVKLCLCVTCVCLLVLCVCVKLLCLYLCPLFMSMCLYLHVVF